MCRSEKFNCLSLSYGHMICVFQWIQQKCSNLDVVYSVEVHTISMTSYRVILRLNFYEKLNWGSAFYSVVADPINFATTNKLFDNSIVTAWQQLWNINWGVRKLPGKIGVRQGSAGSAGVRRGPQNNWTHLDCHSNLSLLMPTFPNVFQTLF